MYVVFQYSILILVLPSNNVESNPIELYDPDLQEDSEGYVAAASQRCSLSILTCDKGPTGAFNSIRSSDT
jgi:hypothetical protein